MLPDWLSLIDLALGGVIALFAIGGFQQGFAKQVSHVITLSILGMALFFAYPTAFRYLGKVFRDLDQTYLMWLILLVLAIVLFIVFLLLSALLSSMIKAQFSERADNAWGLGLGLMRGVLVGLLLMILLVMLGPPSVYETMRVKSHSGRLVCYELVPRIQPYFNKQSIDDKVHQLQERLQERRENGFYD